MPDQNPSVRDLTPQEVARGLEEGRMLLVDVREPNETALERFPGAVLVPLSSFDPADIPEPGDAKWSSLPLRPPFGDRFARGAGARFRLWQPSRGRHFGLESRRTADRDMMNSITAHSSPCGLAVLPGRSGPWRCAAQSASSIITIGRTIRIRRCSTISPRQTGIAVRYDTFDSNDTLEAKLLAGQSGYDVVVPTAYFLARQIKAGIFQKLDKSKLPNLAYVWPEIAKQLAVYDPGNQYAVDYMWGTTGIGYNVKNVKQIFGPDAKIDSWDYVFDPDKIKKFKDCGIHLLDSSDDIMSAGLHYLHLDPNTSDPGDLQKVTDLLMRIRPYVRKFHSSEYLNALATGEICFVVGCSGDVKQAQTARRGSQKRHRDRLFDPQGGRAIVVRQSCHSEGRAASAGGA